MPKGATYCPTTSGSGRMSRAAPAGRRIWAGCWCGCVPRSRGPRGGSKGREQGTAMSDGGLTLEGALEALARLREAAAALDKGARPDRMHEGLYYVHAEDLKRL